MMQAVTSKWRGALWIAAVITVFSAISVYNSFFATELGYVYDPTADRLFEIHLTLSIDTCDKWTPLIPFKYCFHGEVGEVRDQGTLQGIEADRKLAREDIKALIEKVNKKADVLLSDKPSKKLLGSLKINYYSTPAVPVLDLLPKRLSTLKDSTTGQSRDVIAVDVVIARRTSFDKPAELEVVRSAVLIRGRAAIRFAKWLQGSYEYAELPD